MIEPKYTPGPWIKADRLNGPWWHISSEHSVRGAKGGSGRQAVACVHGESKRGAKAYAEMFEANAHLITAAPELLEALQKARPYLQAGGWTASEVLELDALIARALGANPIPSQERP